MTTFSLHNFRYGIQNNRQDALRNNKHPEDLGLLRAGLCRCGICGWSMKVHYHNRVNGHNRTHIHAPEYYCRTRNGGQGVKNNHATTIVIHTLDKAAWKFALRYIKDPSLVRERVAQLRAEFGSTIDTSGINATIAGLKKRMSNLYKLAQETEDEDTFNELKAIMHDLERQKKEAEGLLFDAEE